MALDFPNRLPPLWVLRGGRILRLYRDWVEYVQADTSHTYHHRRVVTAPFGRMRDRALALNY
jgi:hypothetical protein